MPVSGLNCMRCRNIECRPHADTPFLIRTPRNNLMDRKACPSAMLDVNYNKQRPGDKENAASCSGRHGHQSQPCLSDAVLSRIAVPPLPNASMRLVCGKPTGVTAPCDDEGEGFRNLWTPCPGTSAKKGTCPSSSSRALPKAPCRQRHGVLLPVAGLAAYALQLAGAACTAMPEESRK